MNTILTTLIDLGLNKHEVTSQLYKAAVTNEGKLQINSKLKLKEVKDCVYFIFCDDELVKIGKVGGGSRCLRQRLYDYRSQDPTGIKIKDAISQNQKVRIVSLNFHSECETIYGVKIEGSVKGPKLEKALIENALNKSYSLKWNKNKG
jgi:hypothetical protein